MGCAWNYTTEGQRWQLFPPLKRGACIGADLGTTSWLIQQYLHDHVSILDLPSSNIISDPSLEMDRRPSCRRWKPSEMREG